jgi:hypothetical protein
VVHDTELGEALLLRGGRDARQVIPR